MFHYWIFSVFLHKTADQQSIFKLKKRLKEDLTFFLKSACSHTDLFSDRLIVKTEEFTGHLFFGSSLHKNISAVRSFSSVSYLESSVEELSCFLIFQKKSKKKINKKRKRWKLSHSSFIFSTKSKLQRQETVWK